MQSQVFGDDSRARTCSLGFVAMRSRDTAVLLFSATCDVDDVCLGRAGKREENLELHFHYRCSSTSTKGCIHTHSSYSPLD